MNCDFLERDGSCSAACKRFSVPCSMAVRRWTQKQLASDPVLAVIVLAVLVLAALL